MRRAVGRWLIPLARQRWFQAAAATAGVISLAVAVTQVVPVGGVTAARPLATGCGLVPCGASLPADVTSAPSLTVMPLTHPRRPRRAHPVPHRPAPAPSVAPSTAPTPRPPSPSPRQTPVPRPSPSPRQPRGPLVTVSFSVDRTGFLSDRFIAHLTVTN